MEAKSNFKVIIVGGGIGGLTLANSLQHAKIDYTVVENRDSLVAPQGASMGILPNGARILDQLGCYEPLSSLTLSVQRTRSHRQDGSLIGGVSDILKLMARRTGYHVFFLERHRLMQVLFSRIQQPDRIKLGSAVKSITQSPDSVSLKLANGTTLTGDVVIGADGIYSTVRREMWRSAELNGQGAMFDQDKKAVCAEYKCLFGISKDIPGMQPGREERTFAKGMSTLTYCGPESKVFWFVFVKMDQLYREPHIPRFTAADESALIDEIGFLPILEDAIVTVRDLHQARVTTRLVSLEEAEFKEWSYGRSVCIGDAIHKTTPNLGAGASLAIESAAALSNMIVRLSSEAAAEGDQKPSQSSITDAFNEYQRARELRAVKATKVSGMLTRIQALNGFLESLYIHYIAPRSEEYAIEAFSDFVIGATMIKHLPIPARSVQGTMPFNPRQGWGYEEPKGPRLLRALPLLILAVLPMLLDSDPTEPTLQTPAGKTFNLVSEAIYAIWLLEATRLKNKGTLFQL